MAKRKIQKKTAFKDFYCMTCQKYTFKKHLIQVHPEKLDLRFRTFGTSGNADFDEIANSLKTINEQTNKAVANYEELTRRYQQEAKLRNTLATKLNGIIMIIRDGQAQS